jgi:hypothetical protein
LGGDTDSVFVHHPDLHVLQEFTNIVRSRLDAFQFSVTCVDDFMFIFNSKNYFFKLLNDHEIQNRGTWNSQKTTPVCVKRIVNDMISIVSSLSVNHSFIADDNLTDRPSIFSAIELEISKLPVSLFRSSSDICDFQMKQCTKHLVLKRNLSGFHAFISHSASRRHSLYFKNEGDLSQIDLTDNRHFNWFHKAILFFAITHNVDIPQGTFCATYVRTRSDFNSKQLPFFPYITVTRLEREESVECSDNVVVMNRESITQLLKVIDFEYYLNLGAKCRDEILSSMKASSFTVL